MAYQLPCCPASAPCCRSICVRALLTQLKGGMSASDLPDELWARVLELGATSSALGFRDLCCLAIASPRLGRLSLHPTLWSALLSHDFPFQSQQSSSSTSQQQQLHPKSLYKTKFERHKVQIAEGLRGVACVPGWIYGCGSRGEGWIYREEQAQRQLIPQSSCSSPATSPAAATEMPCASPHVAVVLVQLRRPSCPAGVLAAWVGVDAAWLPAQSLPSDSPLASKLVAVGHLAASVV